MISIEALIEQKNAWLSSQVDVEFPTTQSLQGRELYLTRQQQSSYARLEEIDSVPDNIEIHQVDFHRLTILYAQLQAKQWQEPESQSAVLEFLAQTILSDDHALYLAFHEQELLFAVMLTCREHLALISDIAVVQPRLTEINHQQIAKLIGDKLGLADKEIWYLC